MPRTVPRMIGSTVNSRISTDAGMYGSNSAAAGTSGRAPTMSGNSFSATLIQDLLVAPACASCKTSSHSTVEAPPRGRASSAAGRRRPRRRSVGWLAPVLTPNDMVTTTIDELLALLTTQLAQSPPADRARFREVAIPPARWVLTPWGDDTGG